MIRYTSRKRRNATEQLCASQPGGSQISKSRVAAQVTYFRSASRPGGVCTLLRLPGNGSAGAGIAPLPAVQQHYSPRAKVEKRHSALTLPGRLHLGEESLDPRRIYADRRPNGTAGPIQSGHRKIPFAGRYPADTQSGLRLRSAIWKRPEVLGGANGILNGRGWRVDQPILIKWRCGRTSSVPEHSAKASE